MEKQLSKKSVKDLFGAIASLETPAQCKNFLRDLCTLAEIEAMAERLSVARLLDKNISYREIGKKTGASTTTVTRIAHWLHHGMGGYKLVLKRLK